MEQTIINAVMGILLSGIGFLVTRTWNTISHLQKRDEELNDKVAHIELMAARCYVTREDTQKYREETARSFERIFDKLDRIEQKIASDGTKR